MKLRTGHCEQKISTSSTRRKADQLALKLGCWQLWKLAVDFSVKMLNVGTDTVDLSVGTTGRNLICSDFAGITPDDKVLLLGKLVKPLAGGRKDDAYFQHLAHQDCSPLQFVSILLSFAKREYGGVQKVGNVCIAMASVDNTLYITSNVDTLEECDMTLAKEAVDAKYGQFLKLFDFDAAFRKTLLASVDASEVINNLNISVDCKNTILQGISSGANVEAVTPPESARIIYDNVLHGFFDLVRAWLKLENRNEKCAEAVFAIEILALHLPYLSDEHMFKDFFDSVWESVFNFVVLQLSSAIMVKEARKNTPGAFYAFQQLSDPLVASRQNMVAAYMSIQGRHPVVAKLVSSLSDLAKYQKVIVVSSSGLPAGKVLHCEVKLFCYFHVHQIPTADREFIVSKALCMDCSMFFFAKVDMAKRPRFQATCRDHFANVLCCTPCDVIDNALDTNDVSKYSWRYFCGCRRPVSTLRASLVATLKFSVYVIRAV